MSEENQQLMLADPQEFSLLSRGGVILKVTPDDIDLVFFGNTNFTSKIMTCSENPSYHNHYFELISVTNQPILHQLLDIHSNESDVSQNITPETVSGQEENCLVMSHGHSFEPYLQEYYFVYNFPTSPQNNYRLDRRFVAIPAKAFCTIFIRCDFGFNAERFMDIYSFRIGSLAERNHNPIRSSSFDLNEILWDTMCNARSIFRGDYTFELPVEDNHLESTILKISSVRDRFPFPAVWAHVSLKCSIKVENDTGTSIAYKSNTLRYPLSGKHCTIYLDELFKDAEDQVGIVYDGLFNNDDVSYFLS